MEKCKSSCVYSKAFNQPFPRLCTICGNPENVDVAEMHMRKNKNVKIELDAFIDKLRKEGDFFTGWRDNISVSFQDAFKRDYPDSTLFIKETADKAANAFLNGLCGICGG